MSVKQQTQATLTEVATVIFSDMVNCPCVRHTRRGEVKLYIFSSLALDGAEWSASHSSHFTLIKRALSTSGGAFLLIMLALITL
jgi:hypothetical protein